jgi:hypothetical protein
MAAAGRQGATLSVRNEEAIAKWLAGQCCLLLLHAALPSSKDTFHVFGAREVFFHIPSSSSSGLTSFSVSGCLSLEASQGPEIWSRCRELGPVPLILHSVLVG